MSETRDRFDLATTLRAVGTEVVAAPELEASFFHRTLARWLGRPEGVVDGVKDPVTWDYPWWRADLVREDGDVVDGRVVYRAHLASGEGDVVETVRWWIQTDARGRIVEAAWLTPPPRLTDDDGHHGRPERRGAAPVPLAVGEAELRRLFVDDD
jgi:hypothetical protein